MEGNITIKTGQSIKGGLNHYFGSEPSSLNEYIRYLKEDSLRRDKKKIMMILGAWGVMSGLQLILYFSFL